MRSYDFEISVRYPNFMPKTIFPVVLAGSVNAWDVCDATPGRRRWRRCQEVTCDEEARVDRCSQPRHHGAGGGRRRRVGSHFLHAQRRSAQGIQSVSQSINQSITSFFQAIFILVFVLILKDYLSTKNYCIRLDRMNFTRDIFKKELYSSSQSWVYLISWVSFV